MNITGKIRQEARYWMIAASVLPLTALSGLFFLQYIGWATNLEKLLTIGATAMFFIAVVWWWWAIWTIAKVTDLLGKAMNGVSEVKDELMSLKKDIKTNE